MQNLWLILAITIVFFLFFNLGGDNVNTFCNVGPGLQTMHNMCHTMAYSNCRAPRWMNGSCWVDKYEKCARGCRGTGKMCNCHAMASYKCGSNDAVAENCYASTHQKCLAGYGLAQDPDR